MGMNNRIVTIDGSTLTSSEVVEVAGNYCQVQIAEESMIRVRNARSVVERILNEKEVVYGINTGFGSLANTQINSEELENLQLNLVRSHATGLGDFMSVEEVRAMMCVRINSLVKGNSGCHPDVIHQLVTFLNRGIHPIVPRIGSLGASGDLAPLSHLAIGLIGEGEVMFDNKTRLAKDVLLDCELLPLQLRAKDGLSLINGTSQMTGFLCLALERLKNLLTYSDLSACMSIEATESSLTPMDQRVHQARPHPGQLFVSTRIRDILSDSSIISTHGNSKRVQDPYSFRCIPQVHGAVLETLQRLNEVVHTELNSATDNPLVFPDLSNPGRHEIVSQGNFHGEILALAADAMSLSLFELSSITERRIDQMLDPNRLAIKPFLSDNVGLESGLMIVQYSAAASLGELHGHASPRTAFSTPTSAGQEDHVSMGSTACWNLLQAVNRTSEVTACELFVARRSLHFIKNKSSKQIEVLKRCIDTIVIDDLSDRTTSSELRRIASELLQSGWLSLIESESNRIPKLIRDISLF